MGRKLGIALKKLTDILNVSSGVNRAMRDMDPRLPASIPESVASKGYKPGLAIELASGTVHLNGTKGREGGCEISTWRGAAGRFGRGA